VLALFHHLKQASDTLCAAALGGIKCQAAGVKTTSPSRQQGCCCYGDDSDSSWRAHPLNEDLADFDREAGYPMAWYFLMLAGKAVPHWVAEAVVEDALDGFAYLRQRDIDVARKWLHRPYAV